MTRPRNQRPVVIVGPPKDSREKPTKETTEYEAKRRSTYEKLRDLREAKRLHQETCHGWELDDV